MSIIPPTASRDSSVPARPDVLCWIGRGQQPSQFFTTDDLARLCEVVTLRFACLAAGEEAPEERAVRESSSANIVIFTWGTAVYSDAVLAQCPALRMLARFGGSVRGLIGNNAWDRGIRVVTAVEAMGRMIAELTVTMMLGGLYRISRHLDLQRQSGQLTMEAGAGLGQRSLAGKVVGLVGFGTISRAVVRLLAPFGCTILAYDPFVADAEFEAREVIRVSDLEELARRADILSLHAPQLPRTREMISRQVIEALRPGSVLVNTAWAHLVDMAALEERVLAGELVACLDNVDLTYGQGEELIQHLRHSPDCLITTIIGMHQDCIFAMGRQLVDEIVRFCRGEPLQHEVSRESLDTRG